MKKSVDCLFIGHNDMDLVKYEETTRKMGLNSGAYRDLNLNFIRFDNRPYFASQAFNRFCPGNSGPGGSGKPLRDMETFSATIAYLGTYLHRRGFTFDYVSSFREEKEELVEKLKQNNILAVAITTTYYVTALPIIEIIDFIRKYNRTATIIVGGPYIATQFRSQEPMVYNYLLESVIKADIYVNSSQGESTLVNVLQALKKKSPLAQLHNIHYRTGDRLASTEILKEDNKLAENMVDWDLFAPGLGEYVNVRTAVSCPFSCAFCGFPQHAGKYQTAGVETVEKEFDSLNRIESIKSLYIIDDTFNVPVKRFKDILRMMIKNNYRFKWHSHLRCQYADQEMVELMKESRCEGIFLGLESGSNQILKNMNKQATVQQYRKGIELLKKYEIPIHGSFIIGFPGETFETVQETVEFIKESRIDFYQLQLWYCEPITPIWKQREKYNLKGESFEWSHATMDSRTACDLVDEIFLTIDTSIAVPRFNFDFENIFHLTNRGYTLDRVKDFLNAFNRGVKDKLRAESSSPKEVDYEVIKQIKESCPAA